MNGYLIDTHTAIWYLEDHPALSETADEIISDVSVKKYLSIVSAWEIAIKTNIGKLNFAGGVVGFLQTAKSNHIDILPIKEEHLTIFETLPLIHRDPFDRLLIATAIAEQITLVTDDSNIAKYDVSQIW